MLLIFFSNNTLKLEQIFKNFSRNNAKKRNAILLSLMEELDDESEDLVLIGKLNTSNCGEIL